MTHKDQVSHESSDRPHTKDAPTGVYGEVLIHPFSILCIALWALNDHYGKGAWPDWLSGKLSDIVSLIGFPLLVGVFFECLAGIYKRDLSHARYVGLTACRWGALSATIVMVGINLWPSWAEAYMVGLGSAQWAVMSIWHWMTDQSVLPMHRVHLTMDSTDLFMTPAAFVGPWFYQKNYNLRPTT